MVRGAMLIFNLRALVMLVVAFGASYGVFHTCGSSSEAGMMMLAGPLLLFIDLTFRRLRGVRLFQLRGGSWLMFLPVWLWGILWTGLGVVDLVRGHR